MSTVFHSENFVKLLAPVIRKHYFQKVRDFDREDLPPILECPDCGYDGEGLEEQLAEIKRKMEQFDSSEIDEIDCLRAIGEILEQGIKK